MKQSEADCIAVYSRKSKFTGKGESIGNQVELCKKYACSHFGENVIERIAVFEDEGFSGGDLNRPGFKNMMKAAEERKFKAVIVYRLDRISRNVSDFSGLIEKLTRLDIAFISIKEQFNTSTPMGRAMMYIASVFSQLERETIAERIRDNMHELAKTGRWLGGITPTGYSSESIKNIDVNGKSKKICKLKLIPSEAQIIKTIFDLFTETNSLTHTESELIRLGIKTKNDKHFTRLSVRAILQNPVYMTADTDAYRYFKEKDADLFSDIDEFDGKHGVIAYNRTGQQKGKTTVYHPTSEWIVSAGKHIGIISGRMWIHVQETLEQNKSKFFRRAGNNESLLTGLLHCQCGSRMYPKITTKKTTDFKTTYTYVCKTKERSRRAACNQKNINGNTVDMDVTDLIKTLRYDTGSLSRRLKQIRQSYIGSLSQHEEELNSVKKQQAESEEKINALVDSLAELKNSSAKTSVIKRIEEHNTEFNLIQKRIHALEKINSHHLLSVPEFNTHFKYLSEFENIVNEMNTEQKRSAVRIIIRKAVLDGMNMHIIF